MQKSTTAEAPEPDRAYSVKEAAARVGVCEDTLRNEARRGRLILRKARRRTIVTAADLAAYLAALTPLPADRPRPA